MNSKAYLITREIFYTLLTALIVFIIMEIVKPNIVQAYINMNLMLILWLVSGIILLVSSYRS